VPETEEETQLAAEIEKSVRDLRRPKHRVAVIGLLKAGKTTLVNGVLTDSNVTLELPTDFKPSTAGIIPQPCLWIVTLRRRAITALCSRRSTLT